MCKQTFPPYALARSLAGGEQARCSPGSPQPELATASGSAARLLGLGTRKPSHWAAEHPRHCPCRRWVPLPGSCPSPQLAAAGNDSALGTSALALGSESKTTAANVQQKEVSESCRSISSTVVPPGTSCPARGGGVRTVARGSGPPDQLPTRLQSKEELVASTVQLPAPPELLQRRAADPSPAEMLLNSSLNTIGSHKSSPTGNFHNALESKHYKKPPETVTAHKPPRM